MADNDDILRRYIKQAIEENSRHSPAQAEWLPTPEEAQLLIDYHKQQATMGEPMGYDVSYHDQRIVWLKQFALPQPPKE